MTAVAYSEAIADVKARVFASRSSFHAGMSILPKERREAMYALYAFCREVDDIADDGATLELRKAGLQQWRERIAALFREQVNEQSGGVPSPLQGGLGRGSPSNSDILDKGKSPPLTPPVKGGESVQPLPIDTISAALAPAIKQYNLFERDFLSVIDGMEMDAGDPICAPDAATFDLYCDRVASAVGRLSIRIFGDASPAALEVSYHLGRALQKTNILRDLGEDAERGRLYLPKELLTKNGVTSRVPAEVLKDKNLPAVCRDLAAEAQDHFAKADAAMKLCNPAAIKPAKIMRAYYGAIFDKLVAADWRDPAVRMTLPKWHKVWIVLRNLVG